MKRSVGRFGTQFLTLVLILGLASIMGYRLRGDDDSNRNDPTATNAGKKVGAGRQVFRFDTFGDESFWAAHSSCIRRSKARHSAGLVEG